MWPAGETQLTAAEVQNDPTSVDAFVRPSPTGFVGISPCSPMYRYEAHWGNQVFSVDCRTRDVVIPGPIKLQTVESPAVRLGNVLQASQASV